MIMTVNPHKVGCVSHKVAPKGGYRTTSIRDATPFAGPVTRLAGKETRLAGFAGQRGLAVLEALPMIIIMFVLMGALLGSWGIVHTAILHSIASRNYIFFIFNNRSDLTYLRDFGKEYGLPEDVDSRAVYFRDKRYRFSYISVAGYYGKSPPVATRLIDYGHPKANRILYNKISDAAGGSRMQELWNLQNRNLKEIASAWIMVGYGICLDAICARSP